MRRLLLLVTALMFLEQLFFAVLSPLLPGLEHQLQVGTAALGVLTAMYALGGLLGVLPAVLVVLRAGARSTAVASLLGLAAASVVFGLARSYPLLLAARFAEGVSGATCWTAAMVWLLDAAPAARRGELLGFAFGVSEAGAIAGPAIGALAVAVGRSATFLAVAVVCLALCWATSRLPAPARGAAPRLQLRAMLAARNVRVAMGLAFLPALVTAAVSVLGPLQQHRLGAGSGVIAATFGVAAIVGIVLRPAFGRWSDRRGPRLPITVALLASVPFALAVPWAADDRLAALLLIATLLATGLLWAPVMVMLSDACVALGMGQVMAVTAMDLTWPPGNAIGASGAAAVAQAAGQRLAYAVIAAALLVGAVALARTPTGVPGARGPAEASAPAVSA